MNTIDSLLPHIAQHIGLIKHLIPKKDARILVSLANQVIGNVFLTENQSKLLVKILQENISAIRSIFQDIDLVLESNRWSESFRISKPVRKIWLIDESNQKMVLEFNSNKRLKEKFSKIAHQVEGSIARKENLYFMDLTEKNIDLIISTFIKDGFDIDAELVDFYTQIQQIKATVSAPFDIFGAVPDSLKSAVISDVGLIDNSNLLKLYDKRIRYQYQISQPISDNSVVAKIATRNNRRIFANSSTIPLTQIIDALAQLGRFPILLVFDGHSSKKDKKNLQLVKDALVAANQEGPVGIYFRYDTDKDIAQFNQTVAELSYNKPLSDHTVVAGINNSKLPKFMVNMQWNPQAIISFTNSFKENKSFVYCNSVDLVVYYTPTPPLGETINEIM